MHTHMHIALALCAASAEIHTPGSQPAQGARSGPTRSGGAGWCPRPPQPCVLLPPPPPAAASGQRPPLRKQRAVVSRCSLPSPKRRKRLGPKAHLLLLGQQAGCLQPCWPRHHHHNTSSPPRTPVQRAPAAGRRIQGPRPRRLAAAGGPGAPSPRWRPSAKCVCLCVERAVWVGGLVPCVARGGRDRRQRSLL